MSSLTAGWVLSGASSQWKKRQARQGVRDLPQRRIRQPGAGGGRAGQGERGRPVRSAGRALRAARNRYRDALHRRIRRNSIDASGRVWFATANDASRIPEPLLNRMNVYEIDPPDARARRASRARLYREIREAHDWGKRFPEAPADGVVEKLARLTPREMRRAVQAPRQRQGVRARRAAARGRGHPARRPQIQIGF